MRVERALTQECDIRGIGYTSSGVTSRTVRLTVLFVSEFTCRLGEQVLSLSETSNIPRVS